MRFIKLCYAMDGHILEQTILKGCYTNQINICVNKYL